jgi:cold-inducible RNA-binding protein
VGKKLYVGNLTYSVTHTDLEEWFTQYGTVQSAQVIQDRDMGRSKGFGFVEMDTDAQAEAAIQGLNNHEHDGRRLVVSEAKPRVARTVGFAGGSVNGSGSPGGGYWK